MTERASATIRIATRSSNLALWQARHVSELLLRANPGVTVELVEVSTVGDRDLVQPLREFGGLGVFTREVQQALLEGRADVAVHSLKDLPTDSHPELELAAIPERGTTADALVLPADRQKSSQEDDSLLAWLPKGARVATGSPRRQAQLKHVRSDLQLLEVRGNVETRLRKLDAGEFDAMILAAAGLERLQLAHRISRRLAAPSMYYAVGQGALGLECRRGDEVTRESLARLTDPATWACATAERALLAQLRAGCHAPVGVLCCCDGSRLQLEGVVLTPDGQRRWAAAASGSVNDPTSLGVTVANLLLSHGAMVSCQ